MVSQRIKSIVNEIEYAVIADIGCDHGFTPIYALETGKIKKAVACDLNTGPVNLAVRNINAFGADDIQIRQGYGLDKIKRGEVDAVIISGMGGMLMIEILDKGRDVLTDVNQLILQPQRDIPEVRRFLHRMGYMIKNEVMLKEDGKFYNIINCRRGVDTEYTDADYLLGKILLERTDAVLYEYLEREIILLEGINEQIERKDSKNADTAYERLKAVKFLINVYREVLACR